MDQAIIPITSRQLVHSPLVEATSTSNESDDEKGFFPSTGNPQIPQSTLSFEDLVEQRSAFKEQLHELLQTSGIAEHDITAFSNDEPTFAPLKSLRMTQHVDSVYAASEKMTSKYAKEILLEEAEMIRKLHDWIHRKGKPALDRVQELEMKIDEFAEDIKSLNLQKSALSDEIRGMNREKIEMEHKYQESMNQQQELRLQLEMLDMTMKTVNATTGHRRGISGKIRASIIANDALTKANDELNAENQNVASLNEQYLQQLDALRMKSEEREHAVDELIVDRNEWQSKFEELESVNKQNLEEINTLNAGIASYKEQVQLLKSSKQSSGDVFQGRTQTVKFAQFAQFTSMTDVGDGGLGPMLGMTSDPSYSVYPITRQGTDTMLSSALGGIPLPAVTVSPRVPSPRPFPESEAISPGKSDTMSQTAKVAELQHTVERLNMDLEKARQRHVTELEKEKELRKADKVKHQEDIGKMQEEIQQLREALMRYKTDPVRSNGCCGSCSVM